MEVVHQFTAGVGVQFLLPASLLTPQFLHFFALFLRRFLATQLFAQQFQLITNIRFNRGYKTPRISLLGSLLLVIPVKLHVSIQQPFQTNVAELEEMQIGAYRPSAPLREVFEPDAATAPAGRCPHTWPLLPEPPPSFWRGALDENYTNIVIRTIKYRYNSLLTRSILTVTVAEFRC